MQCSEYEAKRIADKYQANGEDFYYLFDYGTIDKRTQLDWKRNLMPHNQSTKIAKIGALTLWMVNATSNYDK